MTGHEAMRKAFRGDVAVRPDPMWDRRYNVASGTEVPRPPLGETLGGRKQLQQQPHGGPDGISPHGSGLIGAAPPSSSVSVSVIGIAGVDPPAAAVAGEPRLWRRSPPPPPYAPLHPEQQPDQQQPGGGGQLRRSFATIGSCGLQMTGSQTGSGRSLVGSETACGIGRGGGMGWLAIVSPSRRGVLLM